MSKCHVGKVKCRNCANVDAFTFWDSVNSTLDPELKEQLACGKLTTWACERCGLEAHILFNCLYHDMEKQVHIFLRYSEDDTTQESVRATEKMTKYLSNQGYRLRTVRSFPELVDKIRVFDDRLSDYLIELFKLITCFREKIDMSVPMYYSGLRATDSRKPHLFLILRIDGELYERGYPFPDCLEVAEATMPMLAKHFDATDKWPRVDRDLILKAVRLAKHVDIGL